MPMFLDLKSVGDIPACVLKYLRKVNCSGNPNISAISLTDNCICDRSYFDCSPCSGNAVAFQACSYDVRTVVDGNRALIRSTCSERFVQAIYKKSQSGINPGITFNRT